MATEQKQKLRQHYASDFKEEIIRMLNSGKHVKELSKTFGIGENVLYSSLFRFSILFCCQLLIAVS